jgi:cytochrome c5
MKNCYINFSMTFPRFFLIIFSLIFITEISYCQSDKISIQTSLIPETPKKVFEKSCISCHAKGGNMMAMPHLNFSKWDSYKPDKQATLAADICRVISKGAMPPKSARTSKPETIPTDEQVKSICMWSDSLMKSLAK